jgi:hypothetical protein
MGSAAAPPKRATCRRPPPTTALLSDRLVVAAPEAACPPGSKLWPLGVPLMVETESWPWPLELRACSYHWSSQPARAASYLCWVQVGPTLHETVRAAPIPIHTSPRSINPSSAAPVLLSILHSLPGPCTPPRIAAATAAAVPAPTLH